MSHHSHHNRSHLPQPSPVEARPEASGSGVRTPQSAEELTRRRAYEISQHREGKTSDPLADWTQAERELQAVRDATKR